MDRLSSCYFCGAAPDATLEEHRVVPAKLQSGTDGQKTVVLCGTCRRKLDAVLDTVVAAAESSDRVSNAGAGGTPAADPTENAAADASENAAADAGEDLESTLGDDEEILSSLGSDDAAGEGPDAATEVGDADEGVADDGSSATADAESNEEDAADEDPDDDGPKEPKYTKSRGAGYQRDDEGPTETGSLTGGAFSGSDDGGRDGRGRSGGPSKSSGSGGSSSGSSIKSESSGGGSSGSGTGSGDSGGRQSSESGDDQSGGSGGGQSGGSGGSQSSGSGGGQSGEGSSDDRPKREVTMTRLENTKVMRLLENREFPVDKEEFVTVASNAYQISRDDCEKVLDLAVEHDLLREENGQLYGGDA